jgi:hypothetical protein
MLVDFHTIVHICFLLFIMCFDVYMLSVTMMLVYKNKAH